MRRTVRPLKYPTQICKWKLHLILHPLFNFLPQRNNSFKQISDCNPFLENQRNSRLRIQLSIILYLTTCFPICSCEVCATICSILSSLLEKGFMNVKVALYMVECILNVWVINIVNGQMLFTCFSHFTFLYFTYASCRRQGVFRRSCFYGNMKWVTGSALVATVNWLFF